jgi:hypothetical protein
MSASENTSRSFHADVLVALTPVETPPPNPDDWTDEQWMEWLRATEPVEETDRRVYAPKLSSSGATVLGAAMMGLEQAMYGVVAKPEVTVEVDADGQDDGIKVMLDPDDPTQSTVVIRPDERRAD